MSYIHGLALRRVRELAAMTVADLAAASGVPEDKIAAAEEKGARMVNKAAGSAYVPEGGDKALADALGVEPMSIKITGS